jgi:hypothetical protein
MRLRGPAGCAPVTELPDALLLCLAGLAAMLCARRWRAGGVRKALRAG